MNRSITVRNMGTAARQRCLRVVHGRWSAPIVGAILACSTPIAGAAPNAPSQLTARPVSPTRIDLVWIDNSDDESVFVVERRDPAAGDWTVVWDVLNSNFPQFSDMGLTPGARYEYRVKARDKEGVESAPSNIAAEQTPKGPPLYNNLLRDRPAYASSFHWRKVPAYQAVDGTQWTRWLSLRTVDDAPRVDWLYVDMGSRHTIDKVRIIWQRSYWAMRYEIQVSDDAAAWKAVAAIEKSAVDTFDVHRFAPVSCRYVRFYGIESDSKKLDRDRYGGYSIYEIEAYAPDVEPDPLEWESSAFMKPATASVRGEMAPQAVDSHMGTFWSARPHGREHRFTVDLGSDQDIYEISPYWHVPTDAYEIRLSSDGQAWRKVADQSSVKVTPVVNEELREIHTRSFDVPQRARHVRVVVTGKAIHADPNFTSIILQELLVRSSPHGSPHAPENLSAELAPGRRVRLVWKDRGGDETGFEVLRRRLGASAWRVVATVGRDVTAYEDGPMASGEMHVYRVRAVNERGASLESNEAGGW